MASAMFRRVIFGWSMAVVKSSLVCDGGAGVVAIVNVISDVSGLQ